MSIQKYPNIWVVIPAAGIGSRMQAEVPKQYLKIHDQYLIEITVHKMLQLPYIQGVVVALGKHDPYWEKCNVASHSNVFRVEGGQERSDSVLNALDYCLQDKSAKPNDWVLVHDAARPCVTLEKINTLVETAINNAEKQGDEHMDGAILAAPVADTVKRVITNNEIDRTEDRSQLWLAHTPQFFPLKELHHAIKACDDRGVTITDEASAIEAIGGKVSVVADRRDNIKITVPEDLMRAEMILHQQGGNTCE